MHEVAPDIFIVKVWTPEECAWMIEQINDRTFTPLVPDDHYKTNDIHLYPSTEPHIVRLHEMFFTMLYQLRPEIDKEWRCTVLFDSDSIHSFVAYYNEGKITDLAEHHDSGHITVSIKLNNDYEGCVLMFPRQAYSNEKLDPGTAIIFPGGEVSHPHYCTPLTSGEKYTSTTWLSVGPLAS
jgi:hypothetical protein